MKITDQDRLCNHTENTNILGHLLAGCLTNFESVSSHVNESHLLKESLPN